ncbi:MAG: cupin domain-containing protein [Acidobacteria bacterium]|nr:cupin domain-containing protein [Acidobacteriota bacterium]
MRQRSLTFAAIGVLLSAAVLAQTPAAPAPSTASAQGGDGGQGVGSQGDPDPGVHFVVVVDNPQVRVLQVTLQPGAVRRPHVHNDVTFSMMVPVTGALELTVEQQPPIATVLGQAYYTLKGQTHSFANRTAAPVQMIDLFVKPPAP